MNITELPGDIGKLYPAVKEHDAIADAIERSL